MRSREAAAWPGADQRTTVVLASQLMAAELYQEGFETPGRRRSGTPCRPAGAIVPRSYRTIS